MKFLQWIGIPLITVIFSAGVAWAMVGRNTRDIQNLYKMLFDIKTTVDSNNGYLQSLTKEDSNGR